MKFRFPAVLVLAAVLLQGCSKEDPLDTLPFELISEGHLSYSDLEIIPQQYQVFENKAAWMAFIPELERVNPDRAENLRELDLDFSSKDLIIVIGEYYFYCCSTIKINRIYNDKTLVVEFKESGPGDYAAISQAYVLIQISK